MSEDDRVETKHEEFEAHKLETERHDAGPEKVEPGRRESEVEAEDDDFEAHKLEPPRPEKHEQI